MQTDFRLPIFKRAYVEQDEITKGFGEGLEEMEYVLSNIWVNSRWGKINIKLDWSEAIHKAKDSLRRNYSLEDFFLGKIPTKELQRIENEINNSDPDKDIVTVGCEMVIRNDEPLNEKDYRLSAYYLDNTLIHLFISMNLSTPGMFNCFSRKLQSRYDLEIYKFSSSPFEDAWIESIDNGWPSVKKISLEKTYNWVLSINLKHRQIARNSIERALYAILHVCTDNNDITPNEIIWVSLALEALYETPKAQINKKLIDRIFLFLDIPEHNYKKFKKRIREFYDLRSRFVHGEMDISVPFANNVLDDNILDYESEIIKNVNFGLSIVIATIQKMVLNNWTSLSFTEKYIGNQG